MPRPAVGAARVRAGRALLLVLCLVAACALTGTASGPATAEPAAAAQRNQARADDKPVVKLSDGQAGKGGSVTVTGSGWRPKTLLMMLMCGQNMIGGTNACANSDGRAVTTDAKGGFSKKLPVAEPPKACPCVVHVATVTGEKVSAQAKFKVAGHPVKPLPDRRGAGRIAVLATTRLEGSNGILNWFGSPPSRKLVVTVGNLGSAPVKDPVFEIGTAHGVFAPEWEEQQWRGTLQPGRKAQVDLQVELSAGAHGDYLVSLKYGEKVLAEQPWGVPRPWGVTLFWILLCVVVPAAVFRIGMAVVDRVRGPRPVAGPARRPGSHRGTSPAARLRAAVRPSAGAPAPSRAGAAESAAAHGSSPGGAEEGAPSSTHPAPLPWFTPDTGPEPARHSAPRDDPYSAPQENGPTTPTTKGNT
ncbi:neocarzinostatin apoprotein domain-containing protein [Streptomyces sp. YIM 130001]|uniref:neocarzinostatin apoprotein domain-containing protein n=1 Tax=Streptomyces sp. YIM 130001 TaxID=2259644 RepID=UPI001F0969B4|nr:neocarzinostatin apoprotein domain-containing protein [Streptomyces sp. YIM 130001]